MRADLGTPVGRKQSRPVAAVGWRPPSWASVVLLALSTIGFGISTYLTIAHYVAGATLACPDTGAINCEKVTTSPQSVIFGIPVAVIGLGFFATMAVLNVPALWQRSAALLRWSRMALAASGVVFALYLIYTELFTVHAICLWCTGAHVVAFLTLVVVLAADGLGRTVDVEA